MSVQLLGRPVGKRGFGLMGLTWRPDPVSTESAIQVMKEALNAGSNFWNGGEFYGTPEYNSLHLLNAYFTKYPEDASKVVISIKGGLEPGTLKPTGSEAGVRRSVEESLKILDGKCKIDIFECARLDPTVPVEETVGALNKLKEEGKIGGISLSEVKGATIRRAAKVAKIDAVEIELSLFETKPFHNDIAAACKDVGAALVAYSPLGRGFLTGAVKKLDDIPEGDIRRHMPRFYPENFEKNIWLVHELEKVATKKNVKLSQIALSWLEAKSSKDGNPVIIPIPGTTTLPRLAENLVDVSFTDAEIKELDEIVAKAEPAGDRYPPGLQDLCDQ